MLPPVIITFFFDTSSIEIVFHINVLKDAPAFRQNIILDLHLLYSLIIPKTDLKVLNGALNNPKS